MRRLNAHPATTEDIHAAHSENRRRDDFAADKEPPNPVSSANGLFKTNVAHNAVHILTGLAFLAGGFSGGSLLTIRAVAALYVIVAIAGFLTNGDMLLGVVRINDADRWLHAALAAVFAALGGLLPHSKLHSPAHA